MKQSVFKCSLKSVKMQKPWEMLLTLTSKLESRGMFSLDRDKLTLLGLAISLLCLLFCGSEYIVLLCIVITVASAYICAFLSHASP